MKLAKESRGTIATSFVDLRNELHCNECSEAMLRGSVGGCKTFGDSHQALHDNFTS